MTNELTQRRKRFLRTVAKQLLIECGDDMILWHQTIDESTEPDGASCLVLTLRRLCTDGSVREKPFTAFYGGDGVLLDVVVGHEIRHKGSKTLPPAPAQAPALAQ